MENIITTSEPVTSDMPDATPGKPMASLTFYECSNGSMAIEGHHVGEFNPDIQQHRLLQIILDFLPQILSPVDMNEVALNAVSRVEDAQENSLH
jgi:hypothetical protein